MQTAQKKCVQCNAPKANKYELYAVAQRGEMRAPESFWLCAKCARTERGKIKAAPAAAISAGQISRAEFIAALDNFWQASGAAAICQRCHAQGTGCCPPMCRYISENGCQKKNVFCTSFVCSALLNAISECDPAAGRWLKWIKNYVGGAEFRLYEMVTRVPALDRENVRPLALPVRYDALDGLINANLSEQLSALAAEVLLIRQQWHQIEQTNMR